MTPVDEKIVGDTESKQTKVAGMGAIPFAGGVAFRVWAPHAEEVSVVGEFNRWNTQRNPLTSENNGFWYGEVAHARIGQGYRFWLRTAQGDVTRIDPYPRRGHKFDRQRYHSRPTL